MISIKCGCCCFDLVVTAADATVSKHAACTILTIDNAANGQFQREAAGATGLMIWPLWTETTS
jgi:hypothetical protein